MRKGGGSGQQGCDADKKWKGASENGCVVVVVCPTMGGVRMEGNGVGRMDGRWTDRLSEWRRPNGVKSITDVAGWGGGLLQVTRGARYFFFFFLFRGKTGAGIFSAIRTRGCSVHFVCVSSRR